MSKMKFIPPLDASCLAVGADYELTFRKNPSYIKDYLELMEDPTAKKIFIALTKNKKPNKDPEIRAAVDNLREWAVRNRTIHAPPSRRRNG